MAGQARDSTVAAYSNHVRRWLRPAWPCGALVWKQQLQRSAPGQFVIERDRYVDG
jgi:hypothetical protein